jgi:hypothetical protein
MNRIDCQIPALSAKECARGGGPARGMNLQCINPTKQKKNKFLGFFLQNIADSDTIITDCNLRDCNNCSIAGWTEN